MLQSIKTLVQYNLQQFNSDNNNAPVVAETTEGTYFAGDKVS